MPRPAEDAEVRLETGGPADLHALGSVAYATAFFGEPADRFFPAPAMFVELWAGPYLTHGHTVVARASDRIVGYCLGVDRPGDYLLGLLRRLPGLLVAVARGRHGGWTRAAAFGLRALRHRRPGAPAARFPAHLHLALLPQARGEGLGRRLLEDYLARARARGVPGLQLATTDRHTAAVRLYRAVGFETYRAAATGLWRPWVDGEVQALVMVLDLTDRAPPAATPPAAAGG